jgi:hypothetical protein
MPRPRHYVPCISRRLVGVLYREAKCRRMPMTRLVDQLLTDALKGAKGWQAAHPETFAVQEAPQRYPDHPPTMG